MLQEVYVSPQPGAATRALIIGVGHYPALPDGGGPQFVRPEGMRQLLSPPISARRFAQWLIENYQSKNRPLSSVQLLLSETVPGDFEYTVAGQSKSVTPHTADFATVRLAIRQWQASSTHPDDLMLFYFCGHGIADGANVALLMSDFGLDPQSPLDGALDFRRFRVGMEDCVARQQCFFVDACRSRSTLLQRNDYAGHPVLNASLAANPGGRVRIGPVFFSTLAGEPAHGRPGKPSVFTEALLEALNGPGAGDEDGDWTVKTTRLHAAIEFLIRESIRENGWEVSQQPIAEAMQELVLNTVIKPIVPVLLSVDPYDAHAEALLRYDGDGTNEQRAAMENIWSLRLPVGVYNFHADFASTRFNNISAANQWVRPPYLRKVLKAVLP